MSIIFSYYTIVVTIPPSLSSPIGAAVIQPVLLRFLLPTFTLVSSPPLVFFFLSFFLSLLPFPSPLSSLHHRSIYLLSLSIDHQSSIINPSLFIPQSSLSFCSPATVRPSLSPRIGSIYIYLPIWIFSRLPLDEIRSILFCFPLDFCSFLVDGSF